MMERAAQVARCLDRPGVQLPLIMVAGYWTWQAFVEPWLQRQRPPEVSLGYFMEWAG